MRDLVANARGAAAVEDPRTMWLTLGALFFAGTTIGAFSLLLPHPSEFDDRAIWSNIGIACLASLVCALGSGRLPAWTAQLAAVGGTVVITRAVLYSNDPSFYSFFYVWVGLFAFYFFGREWGVAHMALVGVLYAWVLVALDQTAPVARWAMTVATVAVGGIVIDVLVRRVQRGAIESESRARTLAAIGDVAHELARSTEADEARPAICKAAVEVADASSASLWETEASGAALIATASSGVQFTDTALPLVGQPSGVVRALVSGEPFFVADAPGHPALDQELIRRTGAASCLFQPVLRDGSPVAVLTIVWNQRLDTLTAELAGTVELLAAEASIAIERAEFLSRLERVARTDDLTGLPNHRAWEEALPREVTRAGREGGALCVAILDLDNFKEYNDRHGHQAGDLLLKEIAASWQQMLRATDVLARYGGEEFALALPGCLAVEAENLLERLRESMTHGETCSAGLAWWDGEESAQDLFGRADAALYVAKARGRDRVVASADAAPEGPPASADRR
ncbi:MAG: sensor domain-containing diguanylate cyclase [Actinomycetota bacterium]